MRLTGVPAAPGFASGPVWRHRASGAGGPASPASLITPDPAAIAAIAAAQLEEIADQLREGGRSEETAIFEAQAMIAGDSTLLDGWRSRLDAHEEPLAALRASVDSAASMFASVDGKLLAARATHLRDVGARMARIVTGEDLDLPGEASIVVIGDLPPSALAAFPPGLLLGIALEAGSRTGDAAVLAAKLGIPCVVGVAGLQDAVDRELASATGTGPELAVDGIAGVVFTRPTSDELADMRRRRAEAILQDEIARGVRDRPAATRDGHGVKLLATINGPADVPRALEARADGIGLFRTEYLFTGRDAPPTEEEQVDAYRQVFEAFGPDKPVVVRLADLDERSLLLAQVRAISRAAAAANVEPRVMAGMVATRADVDLLNELIRDAQTSLAVDGLSATPHIVTGIVVEVPSAAFLTRELAPRVDFFSIDTDGLTGYLFAADRAKPTLGGLRDALHPAVVRAVRMVTGAAGAAAKRVVVSGELAGDPAGALVLVGLGADELSADPGSLDALRYHLAGVTYEKLLHLAARALDAGDAAEVRALATDLVENRPPVVVPGQPPTA